MKTFIKAFYKLYALFSTKIGAILLKSHGVKYGRNLLLYGLPIISKINNSQIELGDRVVLCSMSYFTTFGVNHPVVLRTLTQNAGIMIGNDVGISGATICAAKKVSIGSESMLGANVIIADSDMHPLNPTKRRFISDYSKIESSEIIIEDNVFIGANSIVLKGVHIGKNSIVGAGSVVTGDIPADSIAAGNPCKVIRKCNSEKDNL